jgi:hypothetical protein
MGRPLFLIIGHMLLAGLAIGCGGVLDVQQRQEEITSMVSDDLTLPTCDVLSTIWDPEQEWRIISNPSCPGLVILTCNGVPACGGDVSEIITDLEKIDENRSRKMIYDYKNTSGDELVSLPAGDDPVPVKSQPPSNSSAPIAIEGGDGDDPQQGVSDSEGDDDPVPVRFGPLLHPMTHGNNPQKDIKKH